MHKKILERFTIMKNLKEHFQSPTYGFLRTDPRLGKHIILLTLGGSYAYGTNVESSDVDLRGIAMNSEKEIFSGRQTFEQIVEPITDTTIYSFSKFVNLLRNANPNMFEILGCRKEEMIYCNSIGQELINGLPLFLSKRVGRSFAGYASMQLNRLLNKASHLQSQEEKEKRIYQSMQRAMDNLSNQLDLDPKVFRFYIDDSDRDGFSKEIYMDINACHFPVRDFNRILKTSRQVVLDFDKIGFRNLKAYQHNKISKHMMHLVRLLLMGIEILDTHEVHTYREKDHDLLMAIRNGDYIDENEEPTADFLRLCDELSKKLDDSLSRTTLPVEIDQDQIDEFVMNINKRHFLLELEDN